MRILHVGKYYAPERGGIESSTQALAESCVADGDAVAVLVHAKPGDWRSSRSALNGVEVRRAGCLAAPLYTPLSPAFPLELARALREFRPDLLHLHFPNPSCFFALLSPAARELPWVVHWHADVPPDAPDWRLRAAYRLYRPWEQAVLRRARAIIATSQPYLDASAALHPWRTKAAIVPLGLAAETPAKPTPEAWPGKQGLRLLAVGRLSHYKGFEVLIEALASCPQVSLLLVGHGECERELRHRASTLGLDGRIRFAGSLDDDALASAYAAADAFVLPSLDRSEAFGVVLLEAMRAGLPVIASAIPGSGVGVVVDDGQTGWLVEPGNAAQLAATIHRLDDAELRQRMGQAGRERWEREFTQDRSTRAVRAVYRRALESAAST